jgi:hypothetical protein
MMSQPLAFVTRPPLAVVRRSGSVVLKRKGKLVRGPPDTWPALMVIIRRKAGWAWQGIARACRRRRVPTKSEAPGNWQRMS